MIYQHIKIKKNKKVFFKGKSSMMKNFDVLHFFTTGAEIKGLRSVLCQSGVWEGHVR